MHGATLSGWLLVALCTATGLYCLLRMRACTGAERRAAGGEALMGLGMAVMALPATVVAQPGWSWAVYAAVFGGAALFALAGAARRGGHHLHHLVGSLAMLYMAVAMAAPVAQGAHSGHGTGAAGGIPVLTGGLLLYYTVYVLRAGARLAPAPSGAPAAVASTVPSAVTAGAVGPGPAWTHRPELTLVCRLSMALATVAMLVTL
ncbi:DUF5134 domain-containing protein [Streptomyces sp. NPDC015130]|uniref:DUF5134 domain-containing protein n=1 Tax=Streptomyces sp. NPDC015130 TaxID=3364940 RepID=UPI0036FBFE0C